MKASQFFISTLKEAPAEAALASHKLMLRAGLIKANASGLYTWMPMGLRVLRKVEAVVREEMNRAGAIELLMPVIQPADLWKESGRWDFYGDELLRITDRHDNTFCFSPTCEELITDIVRKEITSYKQLPKNFYHIQTKFRDERRPRFGVMRAREFVMKDAYSFHADFASLQETYQAMYDAYCRVFGRLGLNFRPVAADTGSIGGTGSHEFQVLAESGEDVIAYSSESDFAANIELAPTLRQSGERAPAQEKLAKVHTPGVKTIPELVEFLQIPIERTLKSIVVEGEAEIVAGHMVEYSGMGFAVFFLGEYAAMWLVSILAVIMFLGGWLPPADFAPFTWIPGWIWLGVKTAIVLTMFIWIRATFPRFRYDQIMRLGWKVFIPVTLVWLLVIGVWMHTPLNLWL